MPRRYIDTYFDEPNDEEVEQVVLDEEYLKQIDKLRLSDYLKYKPTRDFLKHRFDDYINEKLQGRLDNIFTDYLEDFQEADMELLALADKEHFIDLLMLVKHHLEPKYTEEALEDLKYDTRTMRALIHKVQQEREAAELELKRKKNNEVMSKIKGKTFDWKSKKYE